MKNLYILMLLMFSLMATAQTKNFIDLPYLETSAKVDTLVTPDKIYLSITIQEKDSKGRKSVEDQENKMAKKLEELGIEIDKQLTINDLSSNYRKFFLRSKEVLKNKQYSLVVFDGFTAAKVLVALEDLGIANTYLQKTEYSRMEELELALKTRAINKAKNKAKALTQSLGQNVGPAIHIIDNSQPYTPRYANQRIEMRAMAMDEMEPEPLDVDFEKIKVETSISVKFRLLN